jgi:type 1 glutamine amidotransferase
MKRLGKNVVMMRDMTDTFYSSKAAPFVSHFAGNSLIHEYIETYIAPTMVSTDFTGKKQFRFKEDTRPRVAFVVAEDEYRSNQRLHEFAHELVLTKNVNCEFALGEPTASGPGQHNIENLQILKDADIAFFSVRRRALEPEKMNAIKEYAASGKPLVGIRTTSHAFSIRERDSVPASLVTWNEFGSEVLGGNYTGHHFNVAKTTQVTPVPGMEGHPLLAGVDPAGFVSPSWMYKNRPLSSPNVHVLLMGTVPGAPPEPVLWINRRPKGDVIYTSLGHWDDWKDPNFKRLMLNIVDTVVNRGVAKP